MSERVKTVNCDLTEHSPKTPQIAPLAPNTPLPWRYGKGDQRQQNDQVINRKRSLRSHRSPTAIRHRERRLKKDQQARYPSPSTAGTNDCHLASTLSSRKRGTIKRIALFERSERSASEQRDVRIMRTRLDSGIRKKCYRRQQLADGTAATPSVRIVSKNPMAAMRGDETQDEIAGEHLRFATSAGIARFTRKRDPAD